MAGLSVGDVVSECRLNHYSLYSNIKMMNVPIRIRYKQLNLNFITNVNVKKRNLCLANLFPDAVRS